jgi:RNA polymerase-binding transcription factor DksA
MAVTLSARERGRIVEIDEALERMDEGNYGMCAACGFEISDERLQAIPFARHCRDCQKYQERRARLAGPISTKSDLLMSLGRVLKKMKSDRNVVTV